MSPLGRFRPRYGASPVHLLALLASFAIAGAAVVGWFQRPSEVANVLEWFVAAIVIHDLVLLPLYSLLDRIAFGRPRAGAGRARRTAVPSRISPTPYIRIPAILSGLLLLVFFPVIFGLGEETELFASGIPESGYLARWLLATGVMFGLSGIAYAVAVARARAAFEPAGTDHAPDHAGEQLHEVAASPHQAAPGPDQTTPEPDQATPEPDQATPEAVQAAPAPDQLPPRDVDAPPPAS